MFQIFDINYRNVKKGRKSKIRCVHTSPPLSFPLPSHPGPVHRLAEISQKMHNSRTLIPPVPCISHFKGKVLHLPVRYVSHWSVKITLQIIQWLIAKIASPWPGYFFVLVFSSCFKCCTHQLFLW